MRKLDVRRGEAVRVEQTPGGTVGVLHDGRELRAWWIATPGGERAAEWKELGQEGFLYAVSGDVTIERRDGPPVVLAAGECCAIPARTRFRAVATGPAVYLAVSTPDLDDGPGQRIDPGSVRAIEDADREDVRALIEERWRTPNIITRARTHDAMSLPGFLVREQGKLLGVVTLSVDYRDCEVVTIDSVVQGRGVGTALLARAEEHAVERGCDRMWLVTTNDNLRALLFYQRRGFRIIAVHTDAVARSRETKPEIPAVGDNGIPILDEIELEKELPGQAS
jgi:ribosomal protein S18 acetylase RimI-like enzyme